MFYIKIIKYLKLILFIAIQLFQTEFISQIIDTILAPSFNKEDTRF